MSEEPGHTSIDPSHFRHVMGHLPTGVSVVTAIEGGVPAGFAVGSFTSVSLDPPIVSFSASSTSSTLAHVLATGAFCVNVLGADGEELCRRFATRSDDRFAGVGWQPSANGAPRLNDAIAHIDCSVHDSIEVGDHRVVFGAVTELAVHHEGGPLVFYRGGYGRFTS